MIIFLDNFAYGTKYTSPQSQRKVIPNEMSSLPHQKRLLADDSLITPEYKKTDPMVPITLPLDDFEDMKNVCTNVRIFFFCNIEKL